MYAHATTVVVEYARPKPLLHNNYLADQGFTWVASAELENAHRYAVYLQAWGYTTALHPEASAAAFFAGHPDMQEHDIAVAPPVHVIITVANLLTVVAAEHEVTVGPLAHPHAESAHQAAPHAPAPYRPPLIPPWPSDFDKGAQTPTAWSMAYYLSQMDRPHPPALRHSAAPGNHLLSMATPSASQATTQHQADWYKHMALDHPQERIYHPGFIAQDHSHSSLPPGGSRGWSVPPVFTVPVPLATSSLLPTDIGFGAIAPPSGLWGVDTSIQPPINPSPSAPSATETFASYNASTIMSSSTPSPILPALTRSLKMRVMSSAVKMGEGVEEDMIVEAL